MKYLIQNNFPLCVRPPVWDTSKYKKCVKVTCFWCFSQSVLQSSSLWRNIPLPLQLVCFCEVSIRPLGILAVESGLFLI